MSTMMSDGQPPFKTLLGHGLVRDEHGKEMHKSLGNSIEFNRAADDMGVDPMRWLYCRHDPAKNLNFGCGPVNEVRAKVVIKWWNVYGGQFCNYAQLDGFDPSAPPVPVAERPDLDRWILSDLQLLVKKAREAFERYDVMAFCLEAESFIDERLSNWYVRRNRRRLWSKNAELDAAGRRDKLAAYQTLYTVLRELCKLCAPVVPFLTEAMWRNLRTEADPESVHLCDYPTPDESLVDLTLSDTVDALLELVSLGGAARNAAGPGYNVRQPVAELRIQPTTRTDKRGDRVMDVGAAQRRAVERFADQLRDELNVKAVTLHEPAAGPLLRKTATLNPKTAKARYRGKPEEAAAELARLDGAEVEKALTTDGKYTLLGVDLTGNDLVFTLAAPEGWAGATDKGTQVAVDTRLTPALKAEGLARDVIRVVQNNRKDAGLDVADKIALYLGTESDALKQAIAAHRTTIAAETQAVEWADAPPNGAAHTAAVKVDGQPLTIALRKV
jgi:isoleucyl-tRNA synthetase